VGFAVGGTQNGFTLNLAASTANGEANGNSTTWTHAQVQAGSIAALLSGGDTTLIGAEVRGNQVVADIGGNLGIQSVQDIATHESKEHSGGVGVSLCLPPFCYGMSSVSGNVGKGQLDSQYASVTQQSGLKAGDGGFQAHVRQNTNLVGGVITSSGLAVAQGLNHLDTGTLTWRDIYNKASYSGERIALGGGYSFGGAASGKDAKAGDAKTGSDASSQTASAVGLDQKGNAASGTQAVPGKTLPGYNGISASVPIALQAKDRAESTTHSGISGGTITIRDREAQLALTGQTPEQTIAALNRDTDHALNSLAPIFDKEKIEAGFQIVSTLERETGTFLANKAKEADAKAAALRRQADNPNLTEAQRTALLSQAEKITDKWGPGGTHRRVISAGAAAVGGNVTGGAEQFVQAAAVNYLQGLAASEVKQIADALGKGPEAELARATLHTIVGCAGAAAAANQWSCAAGASGAGASSILNSLGDGIRQREATNGQGEAKPGGQDNQMFASEQEAWRDTVATLVTGIAVASGASPATATSAAIVETENNYLNASETRERVAVNRRRDQCRDKACRDSEDALLEQFAQISWDRNERMEALSDDNSVYSATLNEIERDIAGLVVLANSSNPDEANAARSQLTQARSVYTTVLDAQKKFAIAQDNVVRSEQMVEHGYLNEPQAETAEDELWKVGGDLLSKIGQVAGAGGAIRVAKGAVAAAKSAATASKTGKVADAPSAASRGAEGGASLPAKRTSKDAEEGGIKEARSPEGPRGTGAKEVEKLPPLRQAYVDEVKGLEDIGLNMRAAGATVEQVARRLHQRRRELGVQYKELTPPAKLEEIHTRNLQKYGDKLGPSIEWLRAKGKSWEQIIESASRSGGNDLGF
jgi:filamentous hemagglutinin